jgi:trehalose 6-phosphate synthase/phosphatase
MLNKQNNFKRIIIVAYRLPYKLIKKNNEYKYHQNSGGLVSAMLALSDRLSQENKNGEKNKILWIGKADNSISDYQKADQSELSFDIQPVAIPNNINDKFYGGFCNDLLWPLFHYFTTLSVFNESYYENYHKANQLFLNKLTEVIKPGDIIWIHDYHLFLLPSMLRKVFPSANIGFFLHIPFPSFEINRLMPRSWRNEILKGLLGADLIGFHTNDYAQNFLKTVRRSLGYETNLNIIITENRTIKADAFPLGIDFDKFYSASSSAAVHKERIKIFKSLNNQKLIFSVDRLDYTKGILHRLTAFEYFLKHYPDWRGKVVFNIVVVPSRDNIGSYQDMKKEIEATVGRINGDYSTMSWRPIIYQYRSLRFNEMVALYSLSDVALITPLRDGMNLVCKEYIASQTVTPGVLILSEMAGAAAELGEALIINPTDKKEVAEALNKALIMRFKERMARLQSMQKRLQTYNVFTWANDFFNQILNTKTEQKVMDFKLVNEVVREEIINNYKKATKRIIFLDYDGTLVPIFKLPKLAIPEKKVIKTLSKLSTDEKNSIVIISGRDKSFLDQHFSKLNIDLVAEHGALIKHRGKNWETIFQVDTAWKEVTRPILNSYVDRCNGSFIEEKIASIAWHYRNVDPDFAAIRLSELKEELRDILGSEKNLQVLEGNKVLEIKKQGYDKGTAAQKILNGKEIPFILAIGDDKTDEYLFSALPEHAYTIKIGTSPSIAKYNFKNQTDVNNLLNQLINS